MSPMMITLILIWSICLLIIVISAVLYTQAEKVQDEIDILSLPKQARKIRGIAINTLNTQKDLAKEYITDVRNLFNQSQRRNPDGQE